MARFKQHEITHHINPTPDQAVEYIREMAVGKLPIAFDIEIMSGETACVGLANTAHEGMCINFRDDRTNRWSVADEIRVRNALQSLFWDETVQLVAQNGMSTSHGSGTKIDCVCEECGSIRCSLITHSTPNSRTTSAF